MNEVGLVPFARVALQVGREVLPPYSHRFSRRRTIAVDATGLAPGAISTFFIRRREQHSAAPTPFRYWLKWLLAIDVNWHVILAQKAHAGPTNDCATLPWLLNQIAPDAQRIGAVVADAEFDSERNHQHIREQLGAESIIPAKPST